MTVRKIVAALTAAVLFSVAVFNMSAENNNSLIYEKGRADGGTAQASTCCALSLNKESGEFSVLYSDGFAWQSNPVFGGFDKLASGAERTNQRSLLLISYLNAEGNVFEASSFVGSVNKGGMTVNEKNTGAVFTFDFPDIGISVPLEINCAGTYFEASINSSEIKETGDNRLLTVTVLPYFGAGSVSEDGYLLIPDGSGAIISLESPDSYNKIYEKAVYGENSVLYKNTESTVEEQIYMPVFGIKRSDYAMLGIITKGDALAAITANASTGYCTAAPKFTYRQVDTSHLMEGSSREKVVSIVPKTPTDSDFSVRYMFLQGEKADYVGMAECYRGYLTEKYNLVNKSSQGISLDISFTATAETDKSFLGIPYKGLTAFTTLSDIENVFKTFNKEGIENVSLSLSGAFSGGTYGEIPNKLKLCSKVGAIELYEKLNGEMQNKMGRISLLTNFQRIYNMGNGISKTYGAAREVSGAISKQYEYYPENFGKNEERVWYLSNAAALEKITKSFAKSAKKYNVSLGLSDMASELYGDYRLNSVSDRAAMLEAQNAAFKRLYEAVGDIYFQNANIYALEWAYMISDVPTRSSQYDLFTEDVPFYQTVIHGIADYSVSPINLDGDSNKAFLKALEYGSAMRYDLICRNGDEINKSSANGLFSSNADVWLEKIIQVEKEVSDFYRRNAGCTITGHSQTEEGIYRTDYSNGSKSIVNYNSFAVEVYGFTVEAESYLLIPGGVQ